jgi:predicted GNAT family acetyltransferase
MSDQPLDIRRHESGTQGRYEAIAGTASIGELHYDRRDGRLVATHTEVDPRHRGRGVALELVRALVADARREGVQIAPRCSYVRRQFEARPEWQDLWYPPSGGAGRR